MMCAITADIIAIIAKLQLHVRVAWEVVYQ